MRFLALACMLIAVPAWGDEITDCERYAVELSKRLSLGIIKAEIERGDTLSQNVFQDKVGTVVVASEIMGFARITYDKGPKRQRFVCLHPGDRKKPIYFGAFYE